MDRSIPCFVLVAVLLLSAGSLGHPTSALARPGVVPSSILGVGHLPGRSAPRDPMALLPGSPVAEALHHPGIVRPAISPALTIIYPNGTVSNVSAPITVSGNNYTVTSSFVGGLEIERNQTFLHGGGFVITTDLSLTVGVTVWNATGVTIHGLGVHGGTEGFLVANSQSVHLLAVTPNASTSWTIDIEDSSNVTVSASTVIGGSGILAVHVLGLNVSGDHFTNASFFAVYANYASNVEISGDHAEGPFGNVLLEYDEAATISRNVFGGGEYGIYAYSVDALVLRGNAINGSLLGLYFDGTDGVSASGDRVTNASESLTVNSVVNATFDNELLAHAAAQAIGIQSASQVTVENSNATKAAFRGAWIDSSSNVTLDAVNVAGFGAFGVQANDSNGVIVKGVNASGSNQSSSYSVYLNSDLVTQVLNTTGNGTGYGFFATGANGLKVLNSSFSGDPYGLYAGLVLNSHAVQIGGDQFTHSSGQGLYVQSSSQLTITDSNLSYAAGTSLILESCSDATVRGNVLQHSGSDSMGLWSDLGVSVLDNLGGNSSQSYSAGFVVSSGSGLVLTNNSASNTNYSFELSGSSNVELIGNNGSNSYYGLYLQSPSSSTIIGNTFDHDVVAFVSSYAYAVTIYHNNFVNDTSWMNPASAQQVIWDNGYPSGGNHWGNFSGPDLESGPAQNVAGPDGIVDLPMIINATNIDHYPLARPWSAATITFVSFGLSPGTPWSVHVAGSVLSGTTPSLVYAVTNASNGTLGYTVPGVSGYMAPSPASGSVPFTGSSALVAVSFSVFTYPISFHETGLANGTYWSAALGATTLLTATPDANTTAPNGTYTYSVANVTGYALTTPGGSLTVHSGGRTVAVLFVLITHPTIWNNRTDYHNNTVYKNGTNGTGGTGGNGGGGSNGGAPATKAASTGYSAMVVDALVLALAAVAVLAAIGFALWSRARHRPAPPGAQPWSPPATPPPSAINPPAGALGVAAVPSPTSPPVGAAGVPDWKEDP